MTLIPLTPDQRALLHLLIDDAPDDATAQARLLAGYVRWLHEQIVQAHTARRERIVAQSRKETTRHG
jgi:hypothetical protein